MDLKTLLSAFLLLPVVSAPLCAAQAGWLAGSRLPATVASPIPGDSLQVTVHRLKNGLTVYLSPNRETPRISAWIAVRAGSRNDPSDSTGMAHYLEHMFFKGSEKLGTLDYAKERPHLDAIRRLYEEHFVSTDTTRREEIYRRIDKENTQASGFGIPNEFDRTYKTLGFRGINAFTSNEMTVFISDLPKNRLETWAAMEADRFAHPVFRMFQTELETVYEEKNRSMDNAWRILDEALNKALYKDHPYGQTTLGSMEHLRNPSLAKMYDFVRTNYIPNNMTLALAGDFDRAEALKVIEKSFGAWQPKPVTPPQPAILHKPSAPERVEIGRGRRAGDPRLAHAAVFGPGHRRAGGHGHGDVQLRRRYSGPDLEPGPEGEAGRFGSQ
jgi:predicted Zn-dependent peptidase